MIDPWAVLRAVPDPEVPVISVVELGIVRDIVVDGDDVTVTITPTYSGCPAMATMRYDLVRRLQEEGFEQVTVAVSLTPAWSSDWITDRGREALARHGISPPERLGRPTGPVPLSLQPTRRAVSCPRCGSDDVALLSEFGSTACKAMYRCQSCLEPFEHVKEI